MRAVLDFLDGAGWFVLLLVLLVLTWMLASCVAAPPRRDAALRAAPRAVRPGQWWQTGHGWHTGIAATPRKTRNGFRC